MRLNLSIRSKLTFAFLLVLLPFLFLQFLGIRERSAAGKRGVTEGLSGSAQTAAATMDAFIAEIIRKEQSAAQVVNDRGATTEDLNAALAQVRAPGAGGTYRVLPVPVIIPKLETLGRSLQPFAQYLTYLDARGKVLAADPASMVGQEQAAQPEVRAVLEGQVWADSGFKTNVVVGQRQAPGFAVCLGLRATSQANGLICAGVEAAYLRDVLPAAPSGAQTVLLDAAGTVIYNSALSDLSSAARDWSKLAFVRDTVPGRPTTVDSFVSPSDGRRYIGGQTRISSLGWLLGAYRPLDEAMAPVQAATQRDIVVLAVITLLSLGLVQFLAFVLVRPIQELTRHAGRLSRGELRHRLTIASGDETQTLAEAFNTMAANLDRTINDLTGAKEEIARQSEQLQQLLVRTNAVQEDERRRIAFDIHDGVIQLVIGAGFELQAARRQLGNGSVEEAQRRVDEARNLLNQTVTEMRRIVFDLRPTSLDSVGLFSALEKYAASWQEGTGIACTVLVDGPVRELPPDAKVGVYRIVQEALANVRKHAGATRADVRGRFSDGRLVVTIEDNGGGFSPAEAQAASGHLGLMSMSERARALNGQLAIRSAPHQGTQLVLDIPLSDLVAAAK